MDSLSHAGSLFGAKMEAGGKRSFLASSRSFNSLRSRILDVAWVKKRGERDGIVR